MPIRVSCPSCGRSGRVPDNAVGRNVQCPACAHRYRLTAEAAVSDDLELLDDPPPRPVKKAAAPKAERYVDPYADEAPPPPEWATRPPARRDPAARPSPRNLANAPVPAKVAGAIGATLGMILVGSQAYRLVNTIGGPGGDAPVQAVARPAGAAPAPASPEPDFAATARAAAADLASRDDGAGKSLSTAEIVAESEPSIALIRGKGSSGTGFLVGPGLLATNAHVIDDEFVSDLEVRFPSADAAHKGPTRAELLYEDAGRDLAFLAIKSDLRPLRVAKAYQFRKGEDVTVIGNPGLGGDVVLENAISRGVMSTKAALDGQNFYQLGIAINPGNSGGPVFDSSGRVIGVATLKTTKQEALAFCIPVEDLHAALAKLGGQSADAAEAVRSRHRVVNAVKSLGSGGAVYCLAIDLRHAAAASTDDDLRQVAAKVGSALDELERGAFATLAPNASAVGNDTRLSEDVRRKVGEMSANFSRLRELHGRVVSGGTGGDLHTLKQTHRRLITELSGSLALETPKEMLTLFDDRNGAGPSLAAGFGPPSLGSLRQRVWERHGIGPRGIPGPPPIGPPPGFGRAPGSSLRDRMPSRRGRLGP